MKGHALLTSRRALKTLQAKLDFDKSELTLFDEEVKVPLETNSAGQFTVYLLGPPAPPETTFDQSWRHLTCQQKVRWNMILRLSCNSPQRRQKLRRADQDFSVWSRVDDDLK